MRRQLEEAGAELRVFNPVRFGHGLHNLHRDHRKIFIIDGAEAFVGGSGATDDFWDPAKSDCNWHEVPRSVLGLRPQQPCQLQLFCPSHGRPAVRLSRILRANIYISNRITKRQKSIKRSWPDALDLMLICVESGTTMEIAMRPRGREMTEQSPELAEEMVLTVAELSFLQDRRVALENLGLRTQLDGVKNVVQALIQAERYGTPLSQALRVLAQEGRDERMNEAEKKAAALPPKLTVPMILFFLPVLVAVILGPAGIRVADSF